MRERIDDAMAYETGIDQQIRQNVALLRDLFRSTIRCWHANTAAGQDRVEDAQGKTADDIYVINAESVLGLVHAQAGDVASGSYKRQLTKLGEKPY